jgi:hypothetical protein
MIACSSLWSRWAIGARFTAKRNSHSGLRPYPPYPTYLYPGFELRYPRLLCVVKSDSTGRRKTFHLLIKGLHGFFSSSVFSRAG